jgi:hypothetical protein
MWRASPRNGSVLSGLPSFAHSSRYRLRQPAAIWFESSETMLTSLAAAQTVDSGFAMPYQSGGCGFCKGRTAIGTSWKLKNLPA